jgi:hypothetical protein
VTDVGKGFWQTCSQLIIASDSSSFQSIAGVYTDYGVWTFIFYDAKNMRIFKSEKYSQTLANGCFTLQVYDILRFLFEFLDVSPNIAITDSLNRVQAQNEGLAHFMMAVLEKDCKEAL